MEQRFIYFSIFIDFSIMVQHYDLRKECERSLCYDFSNMESFFAKKFVKEALGVGDLDFVSCSPIVYQAMLVDWMRTLEVGIPHLFEDGVKLMVSAGEYDLICNWLGNSRWVHAMEWSECNSFSKASIPLTERNFVVLKVDLEQKLKLLLMSWMF